MMMKIGYAYLIHDTNTGRTLTITIEVEEVVGAWDCIRIEVNPFLVLEFINDYDGKTVENKAYVYLGNEVIGIDDEVLLNRFLDAIEKLFIFGIPIACNDWVIQ